MSEKIAPHQELSILTEGLIFLSLDEESRLKSGQFPLLNDPSRRFVVFADGLLITAYNKVVGLALEDVFDEEGSLQFEKGRFYTPTREHELLQSMFGVNTSDRSSRPLNQSLQGEWIPNRRIIAYKGRNIDQYIQQVTEKFNTILIAS